MPRRFPPFPHRQRRGRARQHGAGAVGGRRLLRLLLPRRRPARLLDRRRHRQGSAGRPLHGGQPDAAARDGARAVSGRTSASRPPTRPCSKTRTRRCSSTLLPRGARYADRRASSSRTRDTTRPTCCVRTDAWRRPRRPAASCSARSPGCTTTTRTMHLGPGDTLVLFTDGVTEATGPLDELYGEERLVALSRTARPTHGTDPRHRRRRAGGRAEHSPTARRRRTTRRSWRSPGPRRAVRPRRDRAVAPGTAPGPPGNH